MHWGLSERRCAMSTKRNAVVMVSAVLASACDGHGPTAPSAPIATSPPIAPSPPTPPPSPAPTPGTQVWNIAVRLVMADGGECVGETLRSSQMGIPQSYSLSVTPIDSRVDVTLRSASGDYECTFPAK